MLGFCFARSTTCSLWENLPYTLWCLAFFNLAGFFAFQYLDCIVQLIALDHHRSQLDDLSHSSYRLAEEIIHVESQVSRTSVVARSSQNDVTRLETEPSDKLYPKPFTLLSSALDRMATGMVLFFVESNVST